MEPHIFRAYDMRGVYGKDLDTTVMHEIGLGLGTYLQEEMGLDTVAVGCDIRFTSDALMDSLVSALLATGCEVTRLGKTAFGETLFGGWKLDMGCTAFITASHLPPQWNGLKLYHGDGEGFAEDRIMGIRDRILSGKFKQVEWDQVRPVRHDNFHDRYIEHLVDHFKTEKPVKVVVDCGNGSACLTAPEALRACGMEVVEVFCNVDPSFPSRPAEPEEKSLPVLMERVVSEKADFGVAFDGDGDRALIVDNKGRALEADPIGILIGKDMLKTDRITALVNVESSMAVERVLEPLGAKVSRIRVGHTFLTLEAKKQGARLGFERSGHMIIPDVYLFDDAMPIPLRVAQLITGSDRTLADMVDDIPKYPKVFSNFQCDDNIKFQVLDNLRDKYSKEYDRVNPMDGVRVDLPEGWTLIRCSNTEPKIRMTVEGNDKETVEMLAERFGGDLEGEMKRLG